VVSMAAAFTVGLEGAVGAAAAGAAAGAEVVGGGAVPPLALWALASG
jgi:hypothetical protein